MAGFGNSAFSVTPFGSGTPATLVAPPTKPPERAAYIDPVTRDYVLDNEGEASRMPEVRQQVVLAVMTIVGSSSTEPRRGIRSPRKIDENIERSMRASVVAATQHIVSAGRATVDDVRSTEVSMGRLRTIISYTDLVAGGAGSFILGPQGSAEPLSIDTLTSGSDTLTTPGGDTLVFDE